MTKGTSVYSNNSGGTWTISLTRDFIFWDYGLPEAVTAPRTEYQIVNALLDAANWPVDKRDIDDSNPTEYAFWENAEGQSVLAMLQTLESVTGGIFYIDREGNAKWESASYRSLNSSVAVATLNNDMHDFSYDLDKTDVYNHIVVTSAPPQVVDTEPPPGGGEEVEVIYYQRLSTTKHLDLGESYIHTFKVSGYYVQSPGYQ